MKKMSAGSVIFTIVGVGAALISLFPLIWMAVSGFKTGAEVLSVPFKFLPKSFEFHNYLNLLSSNPDVQGQGGSGLFPEGASFIRSIVFTFGVSAFSVILSLV